MLSAETTRFIRDLAANNDRDWFKANEVRYKEHYKLAGEALAEMLAVRLGDAIGTPFVPRNFRIFRDVRFSKDKTPYNPYLRIGLGPAGNGVDRPIFMVGLQTEGLSVGAGRFGFEKPTLERFRQRIDSKDGDLLVRLLDRLKKEGARISEPDLKRVPAPFAKDHKHADLLKHKGLVAWRDHDAHDLVYGEEGPAHIVEEMLRLRPLFDWLSDLAR